MGAGQIKRVFPGEKGGGGEMQDNTPVFIMLFYLGTLYIEVPYISCSLQIK